MLCLLIKRGHFSIKVNSVKIGSWDSVIGSSQNCSLIMVFVFQSLKLVHLSCSLFNDFTLLSYTKALEIVKTNPQLFIDIA